MYELRDKIKIAISTLKKSNSNSDNLQLISLLEDTFDIILDRNQELSEALDKLDMLSVDLVRRDVYRAAMIRINNLEQELLDLKRD